MNRHTAVQKWRKKSSTECTNMGCLKKKKDGCLLSKMVLNTCRASRAYSTRRQFHLFVCFTTPRFTAKFRSYETRSCETNEKSEIVFVSKKKKKNICKKITCQRWKDERVLLANIGCSARKADQDFEGLRRRLDCLNKLKSRRKGKGRGSAV